jgi:hypothetical protein
MAIGDLIGPGEVVVGLRVADKAQLLGELARRAAAVLSLEQPALLRALQAREQVSIPRQSRGLYGWRRSKRRSGSLTRPRNW